MRRRILYILLLLLSLCPLAKARTANEVAKAQTANVPAKTLASDSLQLTSLRDSINRLAANPDFIHAYIAIASPGSKVYSCFGHAALHLVCPSNGLDYFFTFEMDMEKTGTWDFLTHKGQAGFAATSPDEFLPQYKEEGRGVTQYELNLTPKEKQELWKLLDEQLEKGSTWTFDYYHNSCTSMVWWAIANVLEDGQLSFPQLPACMKGSYNDAVSYMAEQSPWYGLVWHLIAIDGGPDQSEVTERMGPRIMAEALPYAQIISQDGSSRPLLKGQPQVLFKATYVDKPCWFRPWMALCCLLILFAALVYRVVKRRKRKKQHKQLTKKQKV